MTGYWLDNYGSISSRVRIFSSCRLILRSIQPPFLHALQVFSLGLKWPEDTTHHSPSCSAKVKNTLKFINIPPIYLMTWCLCSKKFRLHALWENKILNTTSHATLYILRNNRIASTNICSWHVQRTSQLMLLISHAIIHILE